MSTESKKGGQAKNPIETQKFRLEKLMKNPVS